MSELDCIADGYKAFKPLLDKLPLSTKVEIYNAIFMADLDPSHLSEEILTLGCAISVDPQYQKWQTLRM